MAGPSVLTLSGTDTYTGGTSVTGGTLDFSSSSALPTTGILNVSRPGTVNLVSLLSGYVPGVVSEDVPADGAAAAAAAAADSGDSDATTAMLGGAPALSQGDAGSAVGNLAVGDPTAPAGAGLIPAGAVGGPAPVPEPGTLVLLLVGAIALAFAAWRRSAGRRAA